MGENSRVRNDRRAQLESKNSARKESLVRSSVPQALKLVRRKIRLKLSYHRLSTKELEGLECRTGGRKDANISGNLPLRYLQQFLARKGKLRGGRPCFRKNIRG